MTNFDTVRALQSLANFVATLPTIGAEVYANGARRGKPIVDRHFTAGNQQRYGFAPLSPKYAKWKAGVAPQKRKEMKASGRVVPKGKGNLPMLVLSGLTRQAVGGGGHEIVQSGDIATIIFRGLPDYDEYLHKGTAKMPKRSPVEPGKDDLVQVHAEMQKALSARVGSSGNPAQSFTSVPGQARII